MDPALICVWACGNYLSVHICKSLILIFLEAILVEKFSENIFNCL